MKKNEDKVFFDIILRSANEVVNTAKAVFINGKLYNVMDTTDSILSRYEGWNNLLSNLEFLSLCIEYDKATDLLKEWREEACLPQSEYFKLYFNKASN